MKDPAPAVTLGPAALTTVMEMVADQVAAAVLAGINVEELQMMDLQTCAAFLGIPLERVTKVLPYAELGPRTRRVRISDYKLYQEANLRYPKNWPPVAKPKPAPLAVVS